MFEMYDCKYYLGEYAIHCYYCKDRNAMKLCLSLHRFEDLIYGFIGDPLARIEVRYERA